VKALRAGLFLDRDGTINTEVDFLRSPDELRLLPGAARAIKEANAAGLPVVVMTNQSGIARGFLTEDDLARVHERLRDLLGAEGAASTRSSTVPITHRRTTPVQCRCDCRKPGAACCAAQPNGWGSIWHRPL